MPRVSTAIWSRKFVCGCRVLGLEFTDHSDPVSERTLTFYLAWGSLKCSLRRVPFFHLRPPKPGTSFQAGVNFFDFSRSRSSDAIPEGKGSSRRIDDVPSEGALGTEVDVDGSSREWKGEQAHVERFIDLPQEVLHYLNIVGFNC